MESYNNVIIENSKGEKEIISIDKIKYMEADRRRLKLNIGDGKNYYIKVKISDFEKELDKYDGFIRISRSYIINVIHVEHWKKRVRVIGEKAISISPRRYTDFEKEILKVGKVLNKD